MILFQQNATNFIQKIYFCPQMFFLTRKNPWFSLHLVVTNYFVTENVMSLALTDWQLKINSSR